jgi:hypothetical protein
MGRYFILAIVLYLIFLACYLAWERRVKRRRNAARKRGHNPFAPAPVEDIIGKSQFDLRHSRPQATTLIQNEKRAENDSTFADGNAKTDGQTPPAAIPKERLDEAFSNPPADDLPDDPDNIDIVVDDRPEPGEETEADGYEENVDADESEDDEDTYDAEETATGTPMATGLGFAELSGMSRTVNNPATATPQERHEAGRVLVEVRKTDLFEQVVSGKPEKKQTAGSLMDDFIAAYNRKKREAGEETDEQSVKAPDDFNPRAFA